MSGYRTIAEKRYLQSDVSVLPGSSGGPLLNGKGEVVGLTAMSLNVPGRGKLNFFIPIDEALERLHVTIDR